MTTPGPTDPPKDVVVDDTWYLSEYPDVRGAIASGQFRSAHDHFVKSGYREGRLPREPAVDEVWYKETYPDVAKAIDDGLFSSAYAHFKRIDYAEGRRPHRKAEAWNKER